PPDQLPRLDQVTYPINAVDPNYLQSVACLRDLDSCHVSSKESSSLPIATLPCGVKSPSVPLRGLFCHKCQIKQRSPCPFSPIVLDKRQCHAVDSNSDHRPYRLEVASHR